MYGGNNPDYELAAKSGSHELIGAINLLHACVVVRGKKKSTI